MKAISEFKYSVQNPIGNELLIVNKSLGNGNYKSYKVKLSDIKAFIGQGQIYFLITENDEEPQLDEQPIITEENDNIVCFL